MPTRKRLSPVNKKIFSKLERLLQGNKKKSVSKTKRKKNKINGARLPKKRLQEFVEANMGLKRVKLDPVLDISTPELDAGPSETHALPSLELPECFSRGPNSNPEKMGRHHQDQQKGKRKRETVRMTCGKCSSSFKGIVPIIHNWCPKCSSSSPTSVTSFSFPGGGDPPMNSSFMLGLNENICFKCHNPVVGNDTLCFVCDVNT